MTVSLFSSWWRVVGPVRSTTMLSDRQWWIRVWPQLGSVLLYNLVWKRWRFRKGYLNLAVLKHHMIILGRNACIPVQFNECVPDFESKFHVETAIASLATWNRDWWRKFKCTVWNCGLRQPAKFLDEMNSFSNFNYQIYLYVRKIVKSFMIWQWGGVSLYTILWTNLSSAKTQDCQILTEMRRPPQIGIQFNV